MTGSISGKIDRYYQKLLEEREREKAKNKPLIEETDVVEFFEKRLGFKATAYQEKLLRDKSQFILARWSRQSGKSLVMAVAVLFNALTRPGFRAAAQHRTNRVRSVMSLASIVSCAPRPLRRYPSFVLSTAPHRCPCRARRVAIQINAAAASNPASGARTSTRVTGHQWDAPFGWAPLQMITVGGLRRYGYDEDADRIARKFIGVVIKEFEEHGVILEKYDLRRRESDVAADIRFGYSANQVGFGWTNAAVVELLAGLRETVSPR